MNTAGRRAEIISILMVRRRITAKELAGMLGVSESQAYKMIRKINLELEKKGFITVKGKVSKYYIEQHWYGFAG